MTSSLNDTTTIVQNCVCCNDSEHKLLFNAKAFDSKQDYSIIQCSHCKVVHTFPQPTTNDLDNSYSEDYYGSMTSKFSAFIEWWSQFAAKHRARKLLNRYANQQSIKSKYVRYEHDNPLNILDMGCGRGVLLDALADLGHKVTGQERKGSPFISYSTHIHCCELEELKLENDSFDIVVIWHVLEHLPSPVETLNFVHKVLKKSGSLFISVPNFESIQSIIFKDMWFHLDLPRHLLHFGRQELITLLLNNGFQTMKVDTLSVDQHLFGFIQSSLNIVMSKLRPSLKNNHLYSILKSNSSWYSKLSIFLYLPILLPLFLIASVEFLFSVLLGRGACINIQCEKISNVK